MDFEKNSGWDGNGKRIQVKGTLYNNGTLVASVTLESQNFNEGCKGGCIAVGRDSKGNAVFVA